MRDAGAANHVVDPDAVESALFELDHPGFEQALNGGPSLSAQFPVTSGNAASVGGLPARPGRSLAGSPAPDLAAGGGAGVRLGFR